MTALAAYRGLLRNPRLTRLLAGEFISSIGDWLYLVALLIVVYRASTDAALLGIVGAARVLPYVILSVPAGIVADRFDRRLVLMVTDVARGVIMVGLAWLVWVDGPLWSIVVLSIAATCFSAFFGPTIGSFLPSLVKDESELGPANSAWSSLENLAFVIGPAVGGLLVAVSNLAIAFLLNAVSFAVVAVVLWRLPSAGTMASEMAVTATERGTATPEGGTAEAGATADVTGSPALSGAPGGFRPILRPVVALSLVYVVGAFVYGGLGILTVVIASSSLGSGDEATGYLNAAIGVGGLIGAIGAGALVLRPRLGPVLLVGAVILGVGLAVLGATNALVVALVAMVVAEIGDLIIEVVGTTIFQRVVPDAIRGRALGGMETIQALSMAAGSLTLPILADGIGITTTLVGSGVAIVAATAIAVAILGSAADRADDPASAAFRRVARLPLFAGVSPARLEAAFRGLARVPVVAGDVIVHQGDPADRFYIIEAGRFEVTQDGSGGGGTAVLREMGPDEVFGEIGLLTSARRTATVTAITEGMLLAIDGPAFLELVGSGPGLATRLLDLHRGATAQRTAIQATHVLSET